MYEPESSSTSRSSRSPSPETPPSSSELLPGLTNDAFNILNNPSTWSSTDQHLVDDKIQMDFNSWTTLGDDLVSSPELQEQRRPAPTSLDNNIPDRPFIPGLLYPNDTQQQSINFFAPNLPNGFDLTPPDSFMQSSNTYPQCLSSTLMYPSYSQPVPPPSVTSGSRQQNPETDASVVTPPREACSNLAIHFPTIPLTGAKSRVETQIRVALDLVNQPASSDPCTSFEVYDRVGSWKCIRLPPGSSTRRRPRKDAKIEASPEDILYLSTEITCASPPNLPVTACSSCQNREAKRTARKLAARVRPARSDDEESSPLPQALRIKTEESDDTGIVQFNCPELLTFDTGTTTLPVRVTCYCRHHREKVGFNIKFTLHDYEGRCVGVGTTPPIMITDDHKTPCKTGNSSDAEADTGVVFPPPSSEKGSLTEIRSKRKRKSKPYDGVRPNGIKTARSSPAPSTLTTQMQNPPGYGLPSPPVTASDSNAPSPSASQPDLLLDPLTATIFQTLDGTTAASPTALTLQPNAQLPTAPPSPQRPLLTPYSILSGAVESASNTITPKILRLIPSSGPTHGGVEITVLGSNFNGTNNLNVMFGDCRAINSAKWSDNALVCILPARPTPGVVAVTFEGIRSEPESGTPALFTYMEESDRALMELALQVVGMRMTGKMEDAKNVAMRIVGGAADSTGSTSTLDVSDIMQFTYGISGTGDIEGLVEKFLRLLDVESTSSITTEEALSLRSRSSQTLLHLAVHMQLPSVVSRLISKGADLDVRDRNGFTPLHFAAVGGWQKGIDLLLDAGADPEIVDAMGRTAEECSTHLDLDFSSQILRRHLNEFSIDQHYDDDAEADVEDEVDHKVVRSNRVSRKPSRASSRIHSGISTPIRRTSSPTRRSSVSDKQPTSALPPSSPEQAKISSEEKKPLDIKADPVVAARELMTWLKTALATIQTGNVPPVPWPLPQLGQIPHLPHLAFPQLPYLPDMQALSQIPMVFPVYVPIPSWPIIPWPQAPTSKRTESGDQDTKNAEDARQDLASLWKVSWEKWTAHLNQVLAQAQPPPSVSDPPPVYSESPGVHVSDSKQDVPQASTSALQLQTNVESPRKRSGTQHSPVTKQELNSFGYRPQARSRKDRGDRMLLWFWLPTLILGFIWGILTSIPLAFGFLRELIPLRDLARL